VTYCKMKTSKNIWIINQYASTPETGYAGRSYYLAKELAKLGYCITLISASYTHLLREHTPQKENYSIKKIDGFSQCSIKTMYYKDARSKIRVLNWFVFAYRLLRIPKFLSNSPDVIMYSSPSLPPVFSALRLCKNNNAKLIFEVRDIWPLTLVEVGGVPTLHPIVKMLQYIEDTAYKKSDLLVSNLPCAYKHIKDRGGDIQKFTWIPNGFCEYEMKRCQPLDKNYFPKDVKGKFIVGYTGTLGDANAIDILIEAAKLLARNELIHFVLVGGGKNKCELVELVRKYSLTNVTFLPSIRKEQVQSALKYFDACYLGWHKSSLYRFGIAPNKLPEYFYAKKPVLHSYSGVKDMVQEAGAGLSVDAANPSELAGAILRLSVMDKKELDRMGNHGFNYAISKLSYSNISNDLANLF